MKQKKQCKRSYKGKKLLNWRLKYKSNWRFSSSVVQQKIEQLSYAHHCNQMDRWYKIMETENIIDSKWIRRRSVFDYQVKYCKDDTWSLV